nr:MAG TPA: hypothetical protein [Caudoviricetes sp.]
MAIICPPCQVMRRGGIIVALEKLNTPLCYLVLSGSIVYAVLLYFFYD